MEKDRSRFKGKSAIEADMDRVIVELLHSASIKKAKKIVIMPDSETKHEYEVKIDPATNQPEVIETVSSTKQECAICGKPVAQIFECHVCFSKVCRNHLEELGVCTGCSSHLYKLQRMVSESP